MKTAEELKVEIEHAMNGYFTHNEDGTPNKDYDPNLGAGDVIDRIVNILAEI